MPTYESPSERVSNGETTTHDTGTVADNLNVLSAECRWRGVTTEETTTETQTANSFISTACNPYNNGTSGTAAAGFPVSTGFEPWTGESNISQYGGSIEFSDTSDQDVTVSFEYDWFVRDKNDITVASDSGTTTLSTSEFVDSDSIYVWSQDAPFEDLHDGGDFVITINNVTDGRAGDIKAYGRTYWKRTVEETTTYQTQDPSVSGDVSASYSGTLSNDEWSSWTTLSGLSEGVNNFNHSISGSGEANFEFQYDWEYALPELLKQLRIGDKDSADKYVVALSNPSDNALEYNVARTTVNGTVYALDLVDPSDQDALSWLRVGLADGTIVCPRIREVV